MRQWWPKPRCCGQWQKWFWQQLLCSVLSSDSPGGGCWVQSAILLFHSISPPRAVGSPFLPGIVTNCDFCTHFLGVSRCISLLLHFLLSDLIVFFMALIEHEGMGKIFREGCFQVDMHFTLFQVVEMTGLLWIFRNSLTSRRMLEVWKAASEVKGIASF